MESVARQRLVRGVCAHCGGRVVSYPKLEPPEGLIWRLWARFTSTEFWWVRCKTCGYTFHTATSARDAIARWNRDRREPVAPWYQSRFVRRLIGW